jgi:S-adenosylmethionine synthetase
VVNLVVEALPGRPVAERRVEMVERKGLGHPDSICDALVEAIAVALHRLYVAEAGAPLHFNVDKALLVAGQCAKDFGAGRVTRPMRFIVGDRATFDVDGRRLPVEALVRDTVQGWLAAHLPRVRPGHLETEIALAPGSVELRGLFGDGSRVVGSNDTSGASGYAPLTPTEALVLGVERFLNGPAFKVRFPDTGEDVKVFAVRRDERVAVTVAMPLACEAVACEAAYFRRKEEVLAVLAERFAGEPLAVDWRLNNLDAPGRGAAGTYLTLTGTSAEDADSGQVGRGNRANGLIALARPASEEAAAGKNAVAHAGKVYSVFSHHLARLVHARCPGIAEVTVYLMARIGEPVDRPWTSVQVMLAAGAALGDVERSIRAVVTEATAGLPAFREALAQGEPPIG